MHGAEPMWDWPCFPSLCRVQPADWYCLGCRIRPTDWPHPTHVAQRTGRLTTAVIRHGKQAYIFYLERQNIRSIFHNHGRANTFYMLLSCISFEVWTLPDQVTLTTKKLREPVCNPLSAVIRLYSVKRRKVTMSINFSNNLWMPKPSFAKLRMADGDICSAFFQFRAWHPLWHCWMK